jgi:hypothetical protein
MDYGGFLQKWAKCCSEKASEFKYFAHKFAA